MVWDFPRKVFKLGHFVLLMSCMFTKMCHVQFTKILIMSTSLWGIFLVQSTSKKILHGSVPKLGCYMGLIWRKQHGCHGMFLFYFASWISFEEQRHPCSQASFLCFFGQKSFFFFVIIVTFEDNHYYQDGWNEATPCVGITQQFKYM